MNNLVKKVLKSAIVATVAVGVIAPGGALALTAEELQVQIQALLAQVANLQAELDALGGGGGGGISGVPAGFTFTKNLSQGSSGDDVMYLQIVLNSNSATQVASSGAGSPGKESKFFGPLTKAAVAKFQELYASDILTPLGLSTGTGFVGSATRTKLNSLLAAAPSPVPTPTPTPTPGGSPTPTPSPTPGPVSGNTLQVSLASDTPAAATVADAGNANMTKFWLTAGEQEVSVSTVWVTRYGLTANSDVENIKILDENGVKVGSIGTLNTDNKAQITFSPALKIAAKTSKAFSIRAGIVDGTAGSKSVALGIASAADVSAGTATVSGTFPIKGSDFTTVALTIGAVEVMEDGALTNSTPDVGEKDVIVNAFKIVVGSTETVTIEQITVTESGSASLSDTNNIELFDVSKNVSLGTTQWTGDGKASWSGLNIVLDKGETRRFRVQLDILNGVGLTVNADLMDGSDVLVSVKGNTYGFYITPDGNDDSDWSNSNDGLAANDQVINSGSLTISKSASTPATGNIAQANNQKLAVFDFLVQGESIKITSLKFSFDLGTMVETEVTSVKVLDKDGKLLAGPADLNTTNVTGANSTTYEGSVTFTDTIILPVGTHPITVTSNIATATSANDTIRVGISDSDATDITATGMTSNNAPTIGPANTEVNANTLTVQAGSLAVRTLADPAAKEIAAGVQDFVFAAVSLDAISSGEDANVTSLTVSNDSNSGADPSEMDNTEIWADLTSEKSARGDAYETRVGTAQQFTSTTDNATDTLAYTLTQTITVKKGSSTGVAVVADIAAGAAAAGTHTVTISAATVTGAATGNSITATFAGSGQAMTVRASGTLTTSVDASEPPTSVVAAGSSGVTIAAFKLAADAVEDLDLDELTFSVTGSNRISTMHLYNGTTPVKSFTAGGTAPQQITVKFDDNTLVIPANSNKVLTVKADFFGNTTVAGDNDVAIGVSIADADATGKASGATVTDTTNRGGNTHRYFKAYPKFTVDSASPSGNLIPTSNQLLATFNVEAVGTADVTFQNADNNRLVVNISQSINDSDSAEETFTLQDENGVVLSNAVAAIGSGTSLTNPTESASESVTFTFATNSLTVPAGQTKKLSIYSDTTELEDAGDTIRLWLSDASDQNLDFGIDGTSNVYRRATIIFRPDIYAGSLAKP